MAAPAIASRPLLLAAAVYIAVTVAMGWRLLGALATSIASDPGDPLLNAAILAWNATHVPWTDAWFQFPIFYPTRDALTLSEHLLGLSVVASPVFWVTGSPAIAYNLTLLLSYPLCGLAMYALAWRLTRSSPAAFVAGLAFAFAPYRASQLPHIQMLAMFWAPLALLGLHRFADLAGRPPAGPAVQVHPADAPAAGPAGSWRWLALFAVGWALQGAANGYMLVYFSILVAMWSLWFLLARRRWRDAGLVVAAAAVAALPLMPILYRYLVAQRELGLSRNLGEISAFGADIASVLCASSTSTVWRWLQVSCAPEGELFPGLGLAALGVLGLLTRYLWKPGDAETRFDEPPRRAAHIQNRHGWSARVRASTVRGGVRIVAVALAVLFLGIAVSVASIGPWRIDLGWFRASASSADKPLSTALALLLIAFLLSDRMRGALARGSIATFYAGAAAVCWILSWGPFPRLFGAPVLYQAPYAWLLQLPGIDALRVPARFWMLTVLCLSVAGGLVMARLLRGRSRRAAAALVAVVSGGLLMDGWTTIPAVALPPPVAAPAALRGAPVMVTPAGDLFRDAATVYHAVAGGWTAINGYSGYEPGYYEALRTLSQAGGDAQYEPFLRAGDINVVDERGVRRLPARPGPRTLPGPPGRRLAVDAVDATCASAEIRYAADGDLDSLWVCGLQEGEPSVTVDLAGRRDVAAIVHALGAAGAAFPQRLVVETSADGSTWDPAWQGSPAALVLDAAMAAPRETRVVIPFASRPARYVRLRQTDRRATAYWAIAELEVWSASE